MAMVAPALGVGIHATPVVTPPMDYYHTIRGRKVRIVLPDELKTSYQALWTQANQYFIGKNIEPRNLWVDVVNFHVSYEGTDGKVVSLYEDDIQRAGDPDFLRLIQEVRSVAMRTLQADSDPAVVRHRPLAPAPLQRPWSEIQHQQMEAKRKRTESPTLQPARERSDRFISAFETSLRQQLEILKREPRKNKDKIAKIEHLLAMPVDRLALGAVLPLCGETEQRQQELRSSIQRSVAGYLHSELRDDLKKDPRLAIEIANYSWDVYGLGLNRRQYMDQVAEHEGLARGWSITEFVAYNLLHPTERMSDELVLGMLGMHPGQEGSKEILEAWDEARAAADLAPAVVPPPAAALPGVLLPPPAAGAPLPVPGPGGVLPAAAPPPPAV